MLSGRSNNFQFPGDIREKGERRWEKNGKFCFGFKAKYERHVSCFDGIVSRSVSIRRYQDSSLF